MLFNIRNFLFFLIYFVSSNLFANTLTFDISQKDKVDEFIENARCIDAKIYDAFLIT